MRGPTDGKMGGRGRGEYHRWRLCVLHATRISGRRGLWMAKHLGLAGPLRMQATSLLHEEAGGLAGYTAVTDGSTATCLSFYLDEREIAIGCGDNTVFPTSGHSGVERKLTGAGKSGGCK